MEILLVTNPENVQLIHPPMRIMGSTLVTLPFIMSVSMLGSRQHMDETIRYLTLRTASMYRKPKRESIF